MANISVSTYLQGNLQRIMTPECKRIALTEWYKQMLPYIPMQSGILQGNVSIEENGIYFHSPYAHYQYVGILYVDPIYDIGAFFDPATGRFWSRRGVQKKPSGRPLNYNKEQHPLATANWGQVAMDLHGDSIRRVITNYLNGVK